MYSELYLKEKCFNNKRKLKGNSIKLIRVKNDIISLNLNFIDFLFIVSVHLFNFFIYFVSAANQYKVGECYALSLHLIVIIRNIDLIIVYMVTQLIVFFLIYFGCVDLTR